jgi:hypothetical protein
LKAAQRDAAAAPNLVETPPIVPFGRFVASGAKPQSRQRGEPAAKTATVKKILAHRTRISRFGSCQNGMHKRKRPPEIGDLVIVQRRQRFGKLFSHVDNSFGACWPLGGSAVLAIPLATLLGGGKAAKSSAKLRRATGLRHSLDPGQSPPLS